MNDRCLSIRQTQVLAALDQHLRSQYFGGNTPGGSDAVTQLLCGNTGVNYSDIHSDLLSNIHSDPLSIMEVSGEFFTNPHASCIIATFL